MKKEIPMLSIGLPSTLKTYRELAMVLSGKDENSSVVKFFDEKIKEQGEDMVVIADESQMMLLMFSMLKKELEGMDNGE